MSSRRCRLLHGKALQPDAAIFGKYFPPLYVFPVPLSGRHLHHGGQIKVLIVCVQLGQSYARVSAVLLAKVGEYERISRFEV